MGSDDVEEMRSKWHALRLRHQGSLRLADWRIFIGEFLRLKALVQGNEEEAKAILMRILPIEFRKKLLQEEDRKTQNTLVLSGLKEHTPDEVMELNQQETGVSLQSISKRGEKFTISVLGVEDKEKIFQIRGAKPLRKAKSK